MWLLNSFRPLWRDKSSVRGPGSPWRNGADHADGDALPVVPRVRRVQLQRVRDGVPEVEDVAQPGVLLVFHHHRGLERDLARDHVVQQGQVAEDELPGVLEDCEKLSVTRHASFHLIEAKIL